MLGLERLQWSIDLTSNGTTVINNIARELHNEPVKVHYVKHLLQILKIDAFHIGLSFFTKKLRKNVCLNLGFQMTFYIFYLFFLRLQGSSILQSPIPCIGPSHKNPVKIIDVCGANVTKRKS